MYLQNIKENEAQGHPLGADTSDLLLREKEVHHTPKDHIHKSVNPNRREQDKKLRGHRGGELRLVDRRVRA